MAAPPQTAAEAPDLPLIEALLVEDDLRLARLTSRYLSGRGVVVTHVGDGIEALAEARRHPYDVILLDLMLPGKDGLSLCSELRGHSDVPIIMVTARGGEDERVRGLELGADDYLTKPFSSRELLARMRALVRRRRGLAGPDRRSFALTWSNAQLELWPARMAAALDGAPLELTSHEFQILHALASRAGVVVSRTALLDLIHGEAGAEAAFDRSIDVHISRLRKKLGDAERQVSARLIKTVRGRGYVLAGAPAVDGDALTDADAAGGTAPCRA
ncbi:MAG: response regulator transcription factor [Myxococcales bacterium]|nr:response regulator transcription factor [Myxococcales bacterium]